MNKRQHSGMWQMKLKSHTIHLPFLAHFVYRYFLSLYVGGGTH